MKTALTVLIFQTLSLMLLAEPQRPLDIYLLIGQSNMAGRAEFSESESHLIEGVYLFDDQGEWEPAANPLNRYSTIRKEMEVQKMGPGYTFSLAMREAEPNQDIGLVVNAKGGTKIEQWLKGTLFYNEAVKRAKIALRDGKLKGILWHQGESNCNNADYLEKITQLIADLRADLESPDVPFVAGQINSSGDYVFNRIILELPEQVPNTAVVSNDGLTAMDRWHFDTQSMRTLGQRYAEKMRELQDQCTGPHTECSAP